MQHDPAVRPGVIVLVALASVRDPDASGVAVATLTVLRSLPSASARATSVILTRRPAGIDASLHFSGLPRWHEPPGA
jgi:hypothetical protein